MKFMLLVLLFLMSDVKPENSLSDPRIIHGTQVPEGKYRSMVYLFLILPDNMETNCGGTILDVDTVLTAAHCVSGKEYILVMSSSLAPEISEDGHEHEVISRMVHENYVNFNDDYTINDIALLKVSPPFSLESGKKVAVTLPEPGEEFFPEELATAVGWGYTEHNTSSSYLQEVELRVVGDEECNVEHEGTIYPDLHLCAGRASEEQLPMGVCFGDSGGPLFVRGMQVGIASFVKTNVTCGTTPGVFTELSHYIDWINQHHNTSSSYLQEVELRVVGDEECNVEHEGTIYPDLHLCAGRASEEQLPMGVCFGDSGGPLFVRGMQVGIASFVKTNVTCGTTPGVFTELSHYIDWINQHVSLY